VISAAACAHVAVAFAAFWVWFGARIFNRRERWAKWTLAAVVGLPALYVASFGPACWMTAQTWNHSGAPSRQRGMSIYFPLGAIAFESRTKSGACLSWWIQAGLPSAEHLAVVPMNIDETEFLVVMAGPDIHNHFRLQTATEYVFE